MSNSHIGKVRSEESKQRQSNTAKGKNKGKIPWNKGKTGVYTDEHRKHLSEVMMGKNKGRKLNRKVKKEI